MGHGLIHALAKDHAHAYDVLALDIKDIAADLRPMCSATIAGDILDHHMLERLVSEYEIHAIFHLAALLSTRSEFTPETAHEVNVTGTLNLLRLAVEQARWHGKPVKFLFPSSIAVYGIPTLVQKRATGKLDETRCLMPTTMYGCNKLYCEHLGRYFTSYYRQLGALASASRLDFRSLRFPGLISADTAPTGGTSDFGPEMLHAAAQGKPYACFVGPDAKIPFMAMPDAVRALLGLLEADREKLTQTVYNVSAFSVSAAEIATRVKAAFPGAEITYAPDPVRAKIVDSWPEDMDDAKARRDWKWSPTYDFGRAFDEYLVPRIRQRYAAKAAHQ